VCIDGKRRVTWAGAGHMIQAWQAGVEFCKATAHAAVPAPVDVVITSCAGYPLDTTWYQAVKGLTGALPIVKKGGTIILAASLTEGLGSHEFQDLVKEYHEKGLNQSLTVASVQRETRTVTRPQDTCEMDEWQLVMFQKVISHCRVIVVSHGLSTEVLNMCAVEHASTVESALAEVLPSYGPAAKLAIIPKGPYVLAHVLGA
jgi:lactate racemase